MLDIRALGLGGQERAFTNPHDAAASNLPELAVVRHSTCLGLLLATASTLSAQEKRDTVDKTFFTRRDLVYTAAAVAGTVAIAQDDEKIARWTQTPNVQNNISHRVVDDLTHVNETPLTIAAILTYGVGRLVGSPNWADVGAHWSEAMAITDATSELIRGPIGRERPRISDTTNSSAFNFSFGKGFTNFGNRSFPSLHSAAAYATAAALTAEVGERHGPVWLVGPVLYTAAAVPGLTRMYLNQHWASDIASGAFVGILFGNKVVHYAHSHRRNRIDRFLLGTNVTTDGRGRFAVVSSFTP